MKDCGDWEDGLISLLPEEDQQPDGSRMEMVPVPIPYGAADLRVDDLGDGRARICLDLPWSVALLVLDKMAQTPRQRDH